MFATFALLAILTLTGCGPNGGLAGYTTGEAFDESIRTVALPIFDNQTFYRETEFRLSEALAKEIEHRTPYKVTAAPGADTIVRGTIVSVDQRLLSRTFEGGLTQEAQVIVTVTLEWKDLRSGEIIRQRSRLTGTGEYIPSRGVGEPFQVAQHEAVAELAREIVSLMRSDW
ncbi:MAG: LptE family protein [Phycisphaeraceae bacterium]